MKKARSLVLILVGVAMLMSFAACHFFYETRMVTSLNGHSTGQPR